MKLIAEFNQTDVECFTEAKSDGANMLHLDQLGPLLKNLVAIKETINSF